MLYTQTFLHTDTFKHEPFYTRTLLRIHRMLQTDPFTHRRFYTQTLLHTYALTHRGFYTQKLLHRDPFTHRSFDTQTLVHTDISTEKRFYTETLLHRNIFTQRRCGMFFLPSFVKPKNGQIVGVFVFFEQSRSKKLRKKKRVFWRLASPGPFGASF